jgi:hypothetical protein
VQGAPVSAARAARRLVVLASLASVACAGDSAWSAIGDVTASLVPLYDAEPDGYPYPTEG